MGATDFWIGLVPVTLLGLVLGSFATALSHRIPLGISWSFGRKKGDRLQPMPRSACPHCHATLQVRDLIPLFSWLFLKGKCRTCKAPIGGIYPAIELLTACACMGFYFSWDLDYRSWALIATVPFLVAMAVIDIRHFILPDILNGLVALLWGAFFLAGLVPCKGVESMENGILSAFAGAVLYGLLAWGLGAIMKKVLKKETLGFGDVKFFAVAGLWLGVSFLPLFLIIAGILGVLMGGIYRMMGKVYFPFGPALIAAFYICLALMGPGFSAVRSFTLLCSMADFC